MSPENPSKKPQSGEAEDKSRFVRLSVNLSPDIARTFKGLIDRKGLSITEGIRRAITIWGFVEEQIAQGNDLAVIESDGKPRKILIL
ncbi:hypothetical protein GCM10009677_57410 [Sphaerisporangium rubeum]|uniref:CopG family transcriptional regulator n=1 Tax=Sphaerisporangium rubeum TaxID=321317 RepID=A0A7X0IIK4_9ACTN|nr:CopG family transcriptional regulator [Sphaerisporangium rubeum]MBB6474342.1 hypothetical protein [Sphaerisporangium rubeum]